MPPRFGDLVPGISWSPEAISIVLNIEVNASVEKIDKSVEKLMSRKNINIDLEENHDNLVDLYLDKTA